MGGQRFILVLLDLRIVLSTILAVDAKWKIFGPPLFDRFLIPPKGLVLSENVENLEPPLHRDSDLFDISSGAIRQRLANRAHTDSDSLNGLLESGHVAYCIRLMLAPWVWHIRERITDVLAELPRRARRDLP